jgi:uncharacterized protein involved in outer membrane biogenesis
MSKAARWIVGIGGFLIVTIVLVFVFFQWSWLRGPLESRLSALTGKEVRIEGPITGDKSWVPHIVLNRIRIAAPNFAAAPEVGTIDRITIAIDLKKLLRGTLDFPLIDIDRPVLALARNKDGANWDPAADAKRPEHRGAMPIIGSLKIADGKISYRDDTTKTRFDAVIATLAAKGGDGEQSFTIDSRGTYRDAPFTLRLKGGSLDALRDTTNPYDLDAAATVGKTSVKIVGTVTDPFKLTDMNLKLTATGDNAGDLYPIFGIPAPSTPPYHLVGTLDRDGKAWLFKNFAGTVGKSDLEGSLRFEANGKRVFVGGNLLSRNLDFADLGLLVGAPGSTAAGRPVSDDQKRLAAQYAAGDRVLPDAPLDLDEVRNVDADVTLKGEHLQAQSLPLDDVDLHLRLDNGVLSLAPLRVGVAGGRIDATIAIDARTDRVATDYDVRFHQFQVARFLQKAGFPQGGSGVIDGRIRLHGTGDSVRKSLATANGQASAVIDHGAISNLAVDIIGLDIAKAVGLFITGDRQVPMRCMVADFQVENGLMTPRTLVLDSDASLITGTGSVNLADEHLDLSIKGQPKSVSPLSLGGPILIGGTFRKPDVGLGKEAIARGAGAVALGALLTPLASIIAFIDPGSGQDADCAGLQRQAQSDADKAPPGTKPAPAHQARRRR